MNVTQSDTTEAMKLVRYARVSDIAAMIAENRELRRQIESGKPVIKACLDCGENAPESGMICDECREAALTD